MIHRTEFQDVHHLVVEAVALLAEQDRSLAFQLDCQRRYQHHRAQQDKREAGKEQVENTLADRIPVGDGFFENVEKGNRTLIAVSARVEAQLVGMR